MSILTTVQRPGSVAGWPDSLNPALRVGTGDGGRGEEGTSQTGHSRAGWPRNKGTGSSHAASFPGNWKELKTWPPGAGKGAQEGRAPCGSGTKFNGPTSWKSWDRTRMKVTSLRRHEPNQVPPGCPTSALQNAPRSSGFCASVSA